MIYHTILTMTILERIVDRGDLQTSVREEQFGFIPGRASTDAIFAAIRGRWLARRRP